MYGPVPHTRDSPSVPAPNQPIQTPPASPKRRKTGDPETNYTPTTAPNIPFPEAAHAPTFNSPETRRPQTQPETVARPEAETVRNTEEEEEEEGEEEEEEEVEGDIDMTNNQGSEELPEESLTEEQRRELQAYAEEEKRQQMEEGDETLQDTQP